LAIFKIVFPDGICLHCLDNPDMHRYNAGEQREKQKVFMYIHLSMFGWNTVIFLVPASTGSTPIPIKYSVRRD